MDITIDINNGINPEKIAEQIEKEILKNHKHKFANTTDGTHDKVCVICGVRAKQAFLQYSNV